MPRMAFAVPRRRARTRDQLVDAFQEARDDLVSTLFHLLGNYADAQDATQEAFVKCWRNYHRLARVRNYRAWIFRVAHNLGLKIRARQNPLVAFDPEVEAQLASPLSDPERTLLDRERTRRFHHAPPPWDGTSPTRARPATNARNVGRSPVWVVIARS